jgi:hypothetical protein
MWAESFEFEHDFAPLPARLPPTRMPATVHYRKNDEVATVHSKIDAEGKPAHNRATDFTINQRKCHRVRRDPLNGLVDRVRELRAKA